MKFWQSFSEVVDTSAESIDRESLPLHAKEPAEEDQIGIRVLGATAALGLTGGRNEVRSSVVIEERKADLFVSACKGPQDLLNLFSCKLSI